MDTTVSSPSTAATQPPTQLTPVCFPHPDSLSLTQLTASISDIRKILNSYETALLSRASPPSKSNGTSMDTEQTGTSFDSPSENNINIEDFKTIKSRRSKRKRSYSTTKSSIPTHSEDDDYLLHLF